MYIGYISYLSLFKLAIILVADTIDMLCSLEIPPNKIASFMFISPLLNYISNLINQEVSLWILSLHQIKFFLHIYIFLYNLIVNRK